MTYYSLTARNSSTYTLDYRKVGNLMTEAGDVLATEAGDTILLENPTNNPNLTSRNSSSYTLPSRS